MLKTHRHVEAMRSTIAKAMQQPVKHVYPPSRMETAMWWTLYLIAIGCAFALGLGACYVFVSPPERGAWIETLS